MTPAELADIHAASFSYAPRPWNAKEIESVLVPCNVHLFEAPHAFAIFRFAGPEAELLTIAVHPDFRRQGLAASLLEKGHESAKLAGVEDIFLEVSCENIGATALYAQFGYKNCTERLGYYVGPNGQKINGLVMKCSF